MREIDSKIFLEAFRRYPIDFRPSVIDSNVPVDANRDARIAWIQEQTEKTRKD